MKIDQDFWDHEFMAWAKFCYYVDKEADIYDVFMRIRIADGNQPFSINFMKQIDEHIKAEDRKNAKAQIHGG